MTLFLKTPENPANNSMLTIIAMIVIMESMNIFIS